MSLTRFSPDSSQHDEAKEHMEFYALLEGMGWGEIFGRACWYFSTVSSGREVSIGYYVFKEGEGYSHERHTNRQHAETDIEALPQLPVDLILALKPDLIRRYLAYQEELRRQRVLRDIGVSYEVKAPEARLTFPWSADGP